MPPIPILMYHHVSRVRPPGFAKYTVDPGALRAQLGLLRRLGYTTVGIDAILDAAGDGAPLPRRPIVLTFDDGFAEAIDLAVPILLDHGARATFFVVAGELGGRSAWLERERGVSLELAGAERIRELGDLGFSIGSHTWSHPHLPALAPEELSAELDGARRRLEDVVGRAVDHLAYPHGEVDTVVRAATAAAGYRSACTTDQRFASPAGDPLALARIIVDGRDRSLDVLCRLRTAHAARGLVRLGLRTAIDRLWRGPAVAT